MKCFLIAPLYILPIASSRLHLNRMNNHSPNPPVREASRRSRSLFPRLDIPQVLLLGASMTCPFMQCGEKDLRRILPGTIRGGKRVMKKGTCWQQWGNCPEHQTSESRLIPRLSKCSPSSRVYCRPYEKGILYIYHIPQLSCLLFIPSISSSHWLICSNKHICMILC